MRHRKWRVTINGIRGLIFWRIIKILWGFPGGVSGKEPAYQCRRQETRVRSLGSGTSPGGGHGTFTPVFLLGESRGQWSLMGYSPWGRQESDTTEVT